MSRQDVGEFDDIMSEESLRNNLRDLLTQSIDGMMSPEALRSQGAGERHTPYASAAREP
jgi:hypothetical protein